MSLPDPSAIWDIVEAGSRDPIFDTLLIAGPVVILIIALVGRTTAGLPITPVLTAGYLAAFLGAVLARWRGWLPGDGPRT